MASDKGNAVDAKWTGPSGWQLWDGTVLNPGDIVLAVGYDEAKENPYWEIVKVKKDDEPVSDVATGRTDSSFGTEEGGGSTGRPELPNAEQPALPAPDTTSTTDGGSA